MYMCDLIVYMFWEMCPAVVVLAGERSLRHKYNIRRRDFNPYLTFYHTNCLWVWAVATL